MITLAETKRREKEARKYVDRVIDEMALSASDIRGLISLYMGKIIDASSRYDLGKDFQFSANPELEKDVNKILDDFKTDLFNKIYLRAETASKIGFEKEGHDYSAEVITALMTLQIEGKTQWDRIVQHSANLRYELEAYIAVGLDRGLSRTRIINTYLVSLKEPFRSPFIVNAFKEPFKASRIRSKGISFGAGLGISSFNNLKLLEQDTIFRSFNQTVHELWNRNLLVVGWYTVRGSSFPCTVCEDMRGIFHPKSELFYGYHRRCTCIPLPVYQSDLI